MQTKLISLSYKILSQLKILPWKWGEDGSGVFRNGGTTQNGGIVFEMGGVLTPSQIMNITY